MATSARALTLPLLSIKHSSPVAPACRALFSNHAMLHFSITSSPTEPKEKTNPYTQRKYISSIYCYTTKSHHQYNQGCGSLLFYGDPDPAVYPNADPDPGPGPTSIWRRKNIQFSLVLNNIKHYSKVRNNGACANIL